MRAKGYNVSVNGWQGDVASSGYTRCMDFCPTALLDISVVFEELGRIKNRLFVTVYPERDTLVIHLMDERGKLADAFHQAARELEAYL